MRTRSWIRKLFARPVIRPFRKAPFRAPALELLEQRTVPSFTVTSTLDDGSVGSLRWAVGQANLIGGDETIDFDPIVFGTPQTITLTGTQLELTDTTGTETITGPAVGVTVSGNNRSRVFQIDGGVSASISGLTITRGHNFGRNQGAGIFNSGTLTLINCTVSGNNAAEGYGSFERGGIFNSGTLTLTNCTVSGNDAHYGGGIFNSGTATLTDCTISGNSASLKYGSGGGLDNERGTVTLTDCTVSGNYASYFGGGVHNTGTATLSNCTVSGNSAHNGTGGGLLNGGTATLTNCTVSGNSASRVFAGLGGGLYNRGTLTLTNCTVSGNSARGLFAGGLGGGFYNRGTLTLTDCTVSGNSASGNGGGVESVAGTTLSNTIVAANTSGGNPSDIYGNINANSSYNLIGTGGSGGLIDGVNHNQVGVANPGLGTLGDHGSATQTIDLLVGSPALNAGDPAQRSQPDQRGVVRSGGVNIGAYQASATAFVLTTTDTVTADMPFDVTVTAVDIFAQVAVGYTGTVTFSTTDPDPNVVLPADYPFTLADGGTHTFTGQFTLMTPGIWTLTATDTDSGFSSSVPITVTDGGGQSPSAPPVRHAAAAIDRFFAALPGELELPQLLRADGQGRDCNPALLWAARHDEMGRSDPLDL
jgi:hypothetical protein